MARAHNNNTGKTLTRKTHPEKPDSGFTRTIKMHKRNADTLTQQHKRNNKAPRLQRNTRVWHPDRPNTTGTYQRQTPRARQARVGAESEAEYRETPGSHAQPAQARQEQIKGKGQGPDKHGWAPRVRPKTEKHQGPTPRPPKHDRNKSKANATGQTSTGGRRE